MIHIEKDTMPPELFQFPLYLYGGGYTGQVVIELFLRKGLKINKIIDDDEGLHGKVVRGIQIISFHDFCRICQEANKVNVVLSSIYGKAILKKLNHLPGIQIYELFDWYSEIIGNKEWIKQICEEKELATLKREWRLLEENWADEKSIEVLNGIWKYFGTKNLNDIAKICTDEEQYFIPEVLGAIRQPLHIVDGGAFRGELLHSLTNNKIKFEKWYCFEPDTENFSLLVGQAKQNNLGTRQVCIKNGLWSSSSRVYFKGGISTGSRIVSYKTRDFIETVSIDEFFDRGADVILLKWI